MGREGNSGRDGGRYICTALDEIIFIGIEGAFGWRASFDKNRLKTKQE